MAIAIQQNGIKTTFKIEKCNNKIFPVISIIIPIYNAEKYINQCIQSILNQTFQNFEIICIDDCSTDKSLEIVQSFSDQRIKIIKNKSNLRSGYCRNIGIKYARGQYILFVDADDFCNIELLDKTVHAIKNDNSDICIFNISRFDTKANKIVQCFYTIQTDLSVIDNSYANIFLLTTPGPIKVFKKSFINDNNIVFSEKIHHSEDIEFTILAIKLAKKISILHDVLYYYRLPQETLTNNESLRSIYVEDFLIAINKTANKIFKLNLSNSHLKNFIKFLTIQINYSYSILSESAKIKFLYLLITKYKKILHILQKNNIYIIKDKIK